jgi:hypothetical protein
VNTPRGQHGHLCPVDIFRLFFAYTGLHGDGRPAPGVHVLSGPPRLAVPVPGGRPPDIETANADAFIDQKDCIRDHGAVPWVLVERAGVVARNDNPVAVGKFAEPIVEVVNLR